MNFLLAITLSVMSTSQTNLRCMTPDDFAKAYPDAAEHYNKHFSDDVSEQPNLHSLMFLNSKKVGRGYLGAIRALYSDNDRMLIERIETLDNSFYPPVKRELKVLRMMCGMDLAKTYRSFVICNSKVVLGFKGCIEDKSKNSMYIFQDAMDKNLNDDKAVEIYNKLSPLGKIDYLLKVIFKFRELHRKDIVHGNIRPENLMMKGDYFGDIRIIDFRMSGMEGTKVEHESSCYTAPEHKKGGYLRFEGDIYSLAVTFSMMERSMRDYFSLKKDSSCQEDFYEYFRMELKETFNEKNGTEDLRDIMLKAVEKDPAQRYESMTDFGAAIQAVRDKLSQPKLNDNKPKDEKIDDKLSEAWSAFKGFLSFGTGRRRRILTTQAGNQDSSAKKSGFEAHKEDIGSREVI